MKNAVLAMNSRMYGIIILGVCIQECWRQFGVFEQTTIAPVAYAVARRIGVYL